MYGKENREKNIQKREKVNRSVKFLYAYRDEHKKYACFFNVTQMLILIVCRSIQTVVVFGQSHDDDFIATFSETCENETQTRTADGKLSEVRTCARKYFTRSIIKTFCFFISLGSPLRFRLSCKYLVISVSNGCALFFT